MSTRRFLSPHKREHDGLLLFSPDATSTGRHSVVLNYLASLGITTTASRWLQMTTEQVNNLYRGNRTKTRSTVDELVDRLFTSGWSLATWLMAPSLADVDLIPLLSILKGPTDPEACRPGHLRWLVGAENPIANGIHTSDSMEEAIREASLLAIDTKNSTPSPIAPSPSATIRRTSASVLYTACCLRATVVSAHLMEPPQRFREKQFAAEQIAANPYKSRGALRELKLLWDSQDESIFTVITRDGYDVLREIAFVCSSSFDSDKVRNALASVCIQLSDWDDLMLRCQASRGPLSWWVMEG